MGINRPSPRAETQNEKKNFRARLGTTLALGAVAAAFTVDQYTAKVFPMEPHIIFGHLKHLGAGNGGAFIGAAIARRRGQNQLVGAVAGATVANFSAELSQSLVTHEVANQEHDDFLSLKESDLLETTADYSAALIGAGILGMQLKFARSKDRLKNLLQSKSKQRVQARALPETATE